MFTELSPLN